MDKTRLRDVLIKLFITAAILIILIFSGAYVCTFLGDSMTDICRDVYYISLTVLIAMTIISIIGSVIFRSKYAGMDENAVNEYLDKRRKDSKDELSYAAKHVRYYGNIMRIYLFAVLLITVIALFTFGIALKSAKLLTGFGKYSVILLFCYLSGAVNRINIQKNKNDFSEYSRKEDYPLLYTLAKKAAKANDIIIDERQNKLHILINMSNDASVARIGNKNILLILGAYLLSVASKDELYQLLIYEFAHISKECSAADRENELLYNIDNTRSNFFTKLTGLIYSLPVLVFILECSVYNTLSKSSIERIAVNAVKKHGSVQSAANIIAKTEYMSRFDFESDEYFDCLYEPCEPHHDIIDRVISRFSKSIEKRRKCWDEMIANETESPNAQRPITRERLKSLGVSEYTVTLLQDGDDSDFRKECIKAINQTENEAYEDLKANYDEKRKEYYIKPYEIIDGYEKTYTVKAEESRDIIDAYFNVLRYEDALKLCNSVIDTSDNIFATAHAHFRKGIILLKRYDKTGIYHLYRAADLNMNYTETVVDSIGEYCYRMGLEDELEEYNKRASALVQKYRESNWNSGLSALDRLSKENLPDGVLERILGYIKSVENGNIKRIYLVHKQITDDVFQSVFVIEFKKGTEYDTAQEIIHKVFNYLDTSPEDWTYGLYTYDKTTAEAVRKVKGCTVYEAND